jgi:hypothetical protein
VAWLAGQVLTYVRSSGERRLQLKWLLSGATIFILAEIALFADDNPVGWWKVAEGVATVGTFALPLSIGFGIMKFRLYDIDRIISRTLAYALVSGMNSPVVVAARRWWPRRCSARCGAGCSAR